MKHLLARFGRPASYAFIGTYFLVITYGPQAFGAQSPPGILHYAVIIVISSALIGTTFGMIMTGTIAITLMTIPLDTESMTEDLLIYISIMTISWISNRKSDRLLERNAAEFYRLAEFGRLSSGIFHDLMNPLTAISLSIEKLREAKGLDRDMAMDQIDTAIKASKRMESCLHIGRKQLGSGGSERFFSINKEIQEVIRLLEYRTRVCHIDIEVDMPQDYEAFGDPVKFFRVMSNLAANAIDSYKDSNSRKNERHIITISSMEKSGNIHISVRDRGCGIPYHIQPFVFDPFFSTKRDANGIGIGLSSIRQIIEDDFKGKISMRSRPGVGSTFTVVLPCAKRLF